MRSPSRHARTVTVGPERRVTATSPGPSSARLDLPVAEAGTARDGAARTGAGGSASPARVKRSVPYSATARRPPPRSSALVPRSSERRGLAQLGRRAARPPGQARAAPGAAAPAVLAQRRERDRGTAAELLERVGHRRVEDLRLVAQLARGLRDRPLGRRRQLAQRVEHLVSHARAREAAVGVRGVLAPLEPARAQVVAHLLAGHARAAAARAGRGAAPSRAARATRARRPAGTAPSPPGRRRCGRRRSRPRRAARPARSARRARAPGGCPPRRARRARRVSGTPQRAQSSRTKRLVARRRPSRRP